MHGIDLLESVLSGESPFNDYHLSGHLSVQSLLSSDVIVYGLGSCAHWFEAVVMNRFGVTPKLGVDQSPDINSWNGVRVIRPEAFLERREEFTSSTVVICLGNTSEATRIKAAMNSAGIKSTRHLAEFYEIQFPLSKETHQSNAMFRAYFDEVREVFGLLEDDLSREIYLRVMQSVVSGIPSAIPSASENRQYFPDDLTLQCGYDLYICCGSYDGENIRKVHEHVGKVTKMICFEPDDKIFPQLDRCAIEYGRRLSADITCLNVAVSDSIGKRRFSSRGGLGSHLNERGDVEVETTDLDSALKGLKPTFISMDIEGEELRALRGSKGTLKGSVPDLGIAVYHNPCHLWRIPKFLNELGAGYRFYLRNYTGFVAETVLYAVAPKQSRKRDKPA